MILQRIIIGLIVMALGLLLTTYSRKVVNWFGEIDFGHYFGGTTNLYRIFGVLVFFGGLIYAFNLLGHLFGR